MYNAASRRLLEKCAQALRAGHPAARERFEVLSLPLVWLTTAPPKRITDPTPEMVTRYCPASDGTGISGCWG